MNQENPDVVHGDDPTLIIQDGYGVNREFVINRSMSVIGREADCDITINDRNVSRRHAVITREPDGVRIRDLDSANGTFVNSRPISTQLIKHLDQIQIGSAVLVFNDPGNAATSASLDSSFGRNTETCNIFTFDSLRRMIERLRENISIVFKGDPRVVRNVIICLLADGHLLLEDAPGVGKSLLAQTLAKSIQAQYRRIQFTPDMMPSDITGMNIYDEKSGAFRFVPGPIFGNVILADEINRTTPRTQASLLECMSESAVTIDGRSHVLPKPFFVVATQNPEDYHGTYPLPEPQLDRFLMRLSIGYPEPAAEREILDSHLSGSPLSNISYVVKGNDVVYAQALVRMVAVSPRIKEYIIRLANATRAHEALSTGCSPRASLALMRSCQSLAAYEGREYVTPHDVVEMFKVVFSHRLTLKLRCRAEYKSVDNVLDLIMASVALPDEDVR